MKKTPNRWMPRKGDVVEIHFLDHVEDSHEPLLFYLYGRLIKVDKKYVVVESWAFPKVGGAEEGSENVKTFTIVCSTIEQLIKLIPAK